MPSRRGSFAAVVVLGLGASAASLFLGGGFRAVVPDRVYRSGQLSEGELEEKVEAHGLRAIVNLRGEKEDEAWYRAEAEVARRHDIALVNIDLVPERLPSRPSVVALVDALETLPEPILIHCRAGVDRTGFASVIAKMAKGGAGYDSAREELSLRYGHVPFGPSSEIGRIFDAFEEHLRQADAPSDWDAFERWAREIYVPYVYSARLYLADFPSSVRAGERIDLNLLVVNTSPGPWTFEDDVDRGIKLGVRLRKEGGRWIDYDRHAPPAGTLPPSREVRMEVSISAPREAGEYEVKLDLVDEHVTWFEDQGSEPFLRPLLVLPSEPESSLEHDRPRRLDEGRVPELHAASDDLRGVERLVERVEDVRGQAKLRSAE